MTCATTKMNSRVVIMCIVPVKVRHVHSGKEIQTYAMLDCCSPGTFINTDLAKKLEGDGMKTTISKSKLRMEKIPKNLKQSVDLRYENSSENQFGLIFQ